MLNWTEHMDGLTSTASQPYAYARRTLAGSGQMAALVASASAALAASMATTAAATGDAHPLAVLGRPAAEPGRGGSIDSPA
jgi:hypothetical protein